MMKLLLAVILFCFSKSVCNGQNGNVFPTINSFYSEKELCLINLHKDNINTSEGFHQSICRGKNNFILNSHPELYGNSKILLPSPCHAGIARRTIGLHALVGKTIGSGTNRCRYRSIWERPYHHLIDADKDHDYIKQYLSAFESSAFSAMTEFGDSVTVQINHFFSCDLLRYGYSLSACGRAPLRYQQHTSYGCDIIHHHLSKKKLVMEVQGILLPCIYQICKDANHTVSTYLDGVFSSRFNNSNGQGRQIVVFNYGLHLPNAKAANTIIQSIAQQLIKWSKLYDAAGDRLAFRETSAQHFHENDGEFSHQSVERHVAPSVHNNHSRSHEADVPFCCEQIKLEFSKHLYSTDALLLEYLNSFESNWRSSLKWLPFHDLSKQLYDVHFESNGQSPTDCTHYVYGSKMYGILAQSLVPVFD